MSRIFAVANREHRSCPRGACSTLKTRRIIVAMRRVLASSHSYQRSLKGSRRNYTKAAISVIARYRDFCVPTRHLFQVGQRKGNKKALAYSTLRGQIVSALNGTDKDTVKLRE